jgi:hypothetical protein
VSFLNRQIYAEAIPGSSVVVAQMLFQPPPEVHCKTNIVKLSILIEGIDSLPMSDILPEKLLVFFDCVATNPFQVLGHEGSLFRHVFTSQGDYYPPDEYGIGAVAVMLVL